MLVWLQGQLTISRGLFECSQWEGERLGTLSPSQSDFCQNTNGDHAIGRNEFFFFLKAMASVFFSLELKTPCVHVLQTFGTLVCCPVGWKLMVIFMTCLFKSRNL